MLTEEATESGREEDGPGMSGKERRRRKREKSMGGQGKKGGDNAGLGREELLKMEEEIGWDRENIIVRKVSSLSSASPHLDTRQGYEPRIEAETTPPICCRLL